MMEAAARELKALGAIPFAAYCTDPCDGRTQGTTGMFDSLPYRNDAATVFRRLIRSLPTRRGVIGVATCDKGLPAMMMALASMHDLPCVLAPGGVTLLAEEGEDAGRVQSVGARFAHNQVTLEAAAENLCRACATPGRRMPVPGHGGHFPGGRRSARDVASALGPVAFRPSHLAGYGPPLGARRALAGGSRPEDARHPDGRLGAQRHGGACGVRRFHQPDSAPARRGACRGPAAPHGRRLDRHQPPRGAPGGCPSQRPPLVHHRAGLPGRRRSGSDAAPAARGPARYRRPHRQRPDAGRHARLVGSFRAPRGTAPHLAGARRHRPGRCDHGPRPRRPRRASLPRSPSRTATWRRKAR